MKPYLASPMAEPYIYDRVLAYLPKTAKHKKILDIATGQGYITERLYHLGFTKLYTADKEAHNFRLSKQEFHFKQVDADQPLPYTDNFFDLIISSETIEHLKNPYHFLAELHRVLKPNGTIVLTTPNVTNIFSRFYFFVSGRLAFHTPDDYRLSGHIAILPDWLLSQTYSSCYLPILKTRLTPPIFLTPFFGWITIYKLKKLLK